jgi:hypothetical protein
MEDRVCLFARRSIRKHSVCCENKVEFANTSKEPSGCGLALLLYVAARVEGALICETTGGGLCHCEKSRRSAAAEAVESDEE